MAMPSPGYSITVRVELPAAANATAALTTAVASTGGALTALDVAESRTDRLVVDVTCDTTDEAHGRAHHRRPSRASRAPSCARSATRPSCSTSAARSR